MSDKGPGLDLRAAAAAASRVPTTGADAAMAQVLRLVPREIQIQLSYTDPDGQPHAASVSTRILSGDQRLSVSRMAAGIVGVSWDSAPPIAREMAWSLSWLQHCLQDPPEWILHWCQEDSYLRVGIYEEVMKHELRYFHGDDGAGGPSSPESRIRVSSPFLAGTSEE
jgi:hypothetical protein